MRKNRILSRLLCEIMVLLLALEPVLPARALDEGDVDEDVLYAQSDYVGFAVKNEGEYSGRFTIGNVEGNPDYASDNDQILLFGHPKPWSSFTTVRLDGEPIIFETLCFSEYSDISNLTSPPSGERAAFASAFASSVFPTPVGPTKRNVALGLSGSFIPTLPRRTARQTALTASS